jgi:hypothetical protein
VATAIPPTPGETTGTPDPHGGAPAPHTTGPWGRFRELRKRNHLAFEVAFFFAGFLFDAILLHRIDSIPLLIHQATYIVLLTGLLAIDHRFFVTGKEPTGFLGKVLSFRHWVIHFFLGTLLNAFMIFYFKSSSGLFSFLFLIALAVVLVINEMPRFRSLGPVLRVALLSFTVSGFLAYLFPILWGSLRSWHYYLALAIACGVTLGLWKVFRRFTHDPTWTFSRAVVPGLAIQGTLLVLYIAHVVPPVPLSLKYIGVFHGVAKVPAGQEHAGDYKLSYVDAPAVLPRFFEHDGADFFARPEDKAWAFAVLFAPTGFDDKVGFAWEYDDPKKGWVDVGTPYFTALGGTREHGWRTFGNRTVARAGNYRVRVVTTDGREIGRKSFEVVADAATEPREFKETFK